MVEVNSANKHGSYEQIWLENFDIKVFATQDGQLDKYSWLHRSIWVTYGLRRWKFPSAYYKKQATNHTNPTYAQLPHQLKSEWLQFDWMTYEGNLKSLSTMTWSHPQETSIWLGQSTKSSWQKHRPGGKWISCTRKTNLLADKNHRPGEKWITCTRSINELVNKNHRPGEEWITCTRSINELVNKNHRPGEKWITCTRSINELLNKNHRPGEKWISCTRNINQVNSALAFFYCSCFGWMEYLACHFFHG